MILFRMHHDPRPTTQAENLPKGRRMYLQVRHIGNGNGKGNGNPAVCVPFMVSIPCRPADVAADDTRDRGGGTLLGSKNILNTRGGFLNRIPKSKTHTRRIAETMMTKAHLWCSLCKLTENNH